MVKHSDGSFMLLVSCKDATYRAILWCCAHTKASETHYTAVVGCLNVRTLMQVQSELDMPQNMQFWRAWSWKYTTFWEDPDRDLSERNLWDNSILLASSSSFLLPTLHWVPACVGVAAGGLWSQSWTRYVFGLASAQLGQLQRGIRKLKTQSSSSKSNHDPATLRVIEPWPARLVWGAAVLRRSKFRLPRHQLLCCPSVCN